MTLTQKIIGIGCAAGLFFSCSHQQTDATTAKPAGFLEDSTAIMQTLASAAVVKDSATYLLERAEMLANKNLYNKQVQQLGLTRYYILTGQLDTAEKLARTNLRTYFDHNDVSDLTGSFLNLMAAISSYRNKSEEAVRYFEEALRVFDKTKNTQQSAAVHFNLANIFFGRLDYQSAHRHATIAQKSFSTLNNKTYEVLASSILSVALAKLDSVEKAKNLAHNTLKQSTEINAAQGIILANYALGECEQAEHHYRHALEYYNTARRISDSLKVSGLALPILAAQGYCYLQLNDYDRGIETGKSALQLATLTDNKEIQHTLNRNLAFAYEQKGDKITAYGYLKSAEDIFRKSTIENNQRTIQEMLTKYETEKKDHQLSLNDNMLFRQKVYISVLLAGIALTFIFLFFFFKSTRQKAKIELLRKEREIELALSKGEEQERKRLSEELHDGIASSLTAIRLQLENKSGEHTLQLVKKTHEEVRRIAHNLMPLNFKENGWTNELQRFLQALGQDKIRINFYTNNPKVELSETDGLILYRAVQELVQNVLKHANASELIIQVLSSQEELSIQVEDNGKGFDNTDTGETTGIKHLTQRLEKIGATLHIESQANQGTTAFIHYKIEARQ